MGGGVVVVAAAAVVVVAVVVVQIMACLEFFCAFCAFCAFGVFCEILAHNGDYFSKKNGESNGARKVCDQLVACEKKRARFGRTPASRAVIMNNSNTAV